MRFGIIGTGFISDWFVDACRESGGTPVAICSRDAARGWAFASRHGLESVTTSPGALANLDIVDAVYVASPIASHYAQTRTTLEHGKHVLCEKTLATSVSQVRDLFELADHEGCVLLEAILPSHDPAYQIVKNALPRLGTVRHAHLEKCQYSSRYPAYLKGETLNALDPASGNSALRDLGVYCIHPCLDLFGEPQAWTSVGYRLDNGFEAGGSTLLDYGSMSVTCTYSKVANSVTSSVIQGETGALMIDSVANPAEVRFVDLAGNTEAVLSGPPKPPQNTLRHEIARFIELCAAGNVQHQYRTNSLVAEQIISGTD
jgi:predicted dehydrogenase